MIVTEVKIKLVPRSDDKLLAFASVTFDRCFVVRDIKIIQGNRALFVAMPSRKITDRCAKCGCKNHLQAQYCNQCGGRLLSNRTKADDRGRAKLHADIAHPINVRCRQDIQEAILKGYHLELERSKLPGYVPTSLDDYDAGPEGEEEPLAAQAPDSGAALRDGASPGTSEEAQSDPKTQKRSAPPKDSDGSGLGMFR